MNVLDNCKAVIGITACLASLGVQAQVPLITKPPQGTSLLVGSPLALSVQASSSSPLSYQWLLGSNALPNATAQTYSVANVKKADGGDYRVALMNSAGSVTSVVATVNVVVSDQTNIIDQLVGHYPFEQSYLDISGHDNAGLAAGAPNWTPTGKCGGAAVHLSTLPDGSAINFVNLSAPDDFTFGATNDFSVSLWFQYTTPKGEFPILANKDWANAGNQGWGIAANANGGLHWNLAGPPGAPKSYDGPAGTLTNGIWHHIAVVFQRNANATTYLDGALVDVQSLAASGNDVTTPAGLELNLGQDGTGTFTGGGSAGIDAAFDDLGIWRRALTPDEVNWIFAKGARSANIQQNVFDQSGGQPTRVSGQWDFDTGDLKATVGQDLEYGDGPGGFMSVQTSFNTTTGFGIPDIDGQPAKVMKYTRSETPPNNYVQGYTMHHGIAPNGGGTLVNQWTLIVDILYPDLHQGDQYSAFIEIQNDTGSDADLAVHEESPGVGGIGISGRYPGNLTQGQWHRVAFAVDTTVPPGVISKFIDGVKAADQTDAGNSGLDGRFSLSEVAHLFSDGGNDNEVNTYYVNSVQIRDSKLTDSAVTALGGPQAAGIPGGQPSSPTPTAPTLIISRNVAAKSLTISWDAATTGFILESTGNLAGGNWSPVPGVVNNSVVVDTSGGTQFYRLKK